MRRLIINADDFGLTAGVNRAIMRAMREGVVTSATLMASSAHFTEAAAVAREQRLRVGCHVTLLDAAPLTPAASLCSSHNGGLRRGFAEFALAALRGRLHPAEIEAEALAQFTRLRQAGLEPTHFDTHKHVHMLPQALDPLLRAATAAGIPAVRNPFAPVRPLAFAHLARRPRLWTRYSEVRLLRALGARFREKVAAAGLRTTDGTFGIVATGALDERLFRAIIGCLPEGTWEFVCHPGYHDAELNSVHTRLRASREKELEVLTSEAARQILREKNVQLISYAEL